MPVGLVEAEHEAARDAVAVHHPLELLVVPDHPVDVVPEMGVRVEDVGAAGSSVRSSASNCEKSSCARAKSKGSDIT